MNVDFLIAHPLKHHAFQLASGCSRVARTALFTPLYAVGVGSLLARFPGTIGRKAAGYFESSLQAECVHSTPRWQISRLLAEVGNRPSFVSRYDRFIANKIERRSLKPRVVITLQDYMPLTVAAAKAVGAVIWSDQISNQSTLAMTRLEKHHKALGIPFSEEVSQPSNRAVLGSADIVTVPSTYAFEGVADLVRDRCEMHVVPYGSNDLDQYTPRQNSNELVIIARANSVRKGGHLLFQALKACSNELILLAGVERVRIKVIGSMQRELRILVGSLDLPANVLIEDGPIPHIDMPALLAMGDLFVMPALSESMSLMCVEAMAAGLPSFITPYCGVDFFKSGEMGLSIDDSHESIAESLLQALKGPSNLRVWGAAARVAAKEFTWARYIANIEVVARSIR